LSSKLTHSALLNVCVSSLNQED